MTVHAASIEVLSPEEVLGIGHGTDILIVDDDAGNRTAYEAALAPLGRRTVLASSGSEALARLLEQDFALVLLDVSMPDMTGLETARLIRARPRNKGMPILFITGAATTNELLLEAYESGAYDFVIKPILPEVLRAKARVYLQLQERAHLLQQLARRRTAMRGLEKLQEATAALSEARTPSEVADVAVRLGAEACGAHAAIMWTLRDDGSLVLEQSHNLEPAFVEHWRVIPAGTPVAAVRVVRDRIPVWVEDEADFAREAPESIDRARAAGRAWAFVLMPLLSNDQVTAVVAYSYQGVHRFSDEERAVVRAVARLCEQALERSRLYAAEADARRVAEALNVRKDEFLAMLGHELRNPLAAMMSALEIIKLKDPQFGREIAILDRQVAHLTHIVGDLVDVSRITRGKISLRREAVSVSRAVMDAIEGTRPLIDQHDVKVTMTDQLLVDADPNRFGQVLMTLLSNASKYTPAPGRIEIGAQGDGSFVTIVLRDNGRGITPSLLPNLFDLFVQGDRAPDRHEGGLGIGLTLARTLVELHGGTIAAHSDGPGNGATFTLRWPQATSSTATGQSQPLQRPRPAMAGLRVLIVDDNADAAEMLAAVVSSLGHDVLLAHDGQQGLEVAEHFAPHIALLDIGLPVIDGYELAVRLRALPSCATTRLIAVTGYGQPEDRERSRRAGFAHHLVKPVELATLRTLIVAADPE